MFRDESNKVIRRAQAQWGVTDASAPEVAAFNPSPSESSSASPSRTSSNTSELSPVPRPSRTATGQITSEFLEPTPGHLHRYRPISPTIEQQGIQFYINRYIVGHPDEPKTPSELTSTSWLWHPSIQDVMAAVGLASLSNLTGNGHMMTVARQKYGIALHHTGQVIQSRQPPDIVVIMRAVVTLAMFEVVKGTHHATNNVRIHIVGAAALMRSWLVAPTSSPGGLRALLQLCYSMFIPAAAAQTPLPPVFFDCLSFSSRSQDPEDKPATELATIIARLVQLLASIHCDAVGDGRPKTTHFMRQLLEIETSLDDWERGLTGKWSFKRRKAPELPRRAVFREHHHVYFDVWVARLYNYYRWSRILANQVLLGLVYKFPLSSTPIISASRRSKSLSVILRMSRETLESTPSHWRHPLLSEYIHLGVEHLGSAGSGAAGLPALCFQIKVACCAPEIPSEFWLWGLDIVDCIWGDMGILQAKSIAEVMRTHRDELLRITADGLLT